MPFMKEFKHRPEEWLEVGVGEVMNSLSSSYNFPERILVQMIQNPEESFDTAFSKIKYCKPHELMDDGDLQDSIYDTLFQNVGMSEYHVGFPIEDISDPEVGVLSGIRFTYNNQRYLLKLERIEE